MENRNCEKKNFEIFLNFSENFDSATILIVWNRQFQQCFRQPSRCPTNMPLGSSCCLWPKSPRLKFHANRSYGFCATEGRILAKMSAFCVTNHRKVTTFLRTRWRPQFLSYRLETLGVGRSSGGPCFKAWTEKSDSHNKSYDCLKFSLAF